MAHTIGIICGSGAESLVKKLQISETKIIKNIKTPYGRASDFITMGVLGEKRLAIIPRHGRAHTINPGDVNYRANIWMLKKLGVTHILTPSAVGSLLLEYKPGDFVITDQYISRVPHRPSTFYNKKSKKVCHINMKKPFCDNLRKLVIEEIDRLKFPYHKEGTCLVFEGPQFSSEAESKMYRERSHILSMTLVPECVLARQAEICYAQIAMISDYDNLDENTPVSCTNIKKIMSENAEKVTKLLLNVIPKIPQERNCYCKNALKDAFIS